MTRKQFLSTTAAGTAAPSVSLAQARSRPKNVLFLLSDQHRPDGLGLLGNPSARTPNLDELARSGTRFSSAYCTNPVCTPSRASILTGLYTHIHRTYTNATPWPFEIKTMAHHFSRAGYISGLIGKMHFVDAQTHGFDYRIDFNDWFQYLGPKTKLYAEELARANSGCGLPQIDDLWRDFGDPWLEARQKDSRQGFVHVGRPSLIPERDHQESFVARETVRFLKRFGRQVPFFMISSFLKPHDPFMPAERFARLFPRDSVKLPETYGKVNLDRVPKEIRERIELDRATPELKDPENARMRIAMYYGSVAQVDDAIGHVLRTLKELDLEQDTVIVYSSDHGEMVGDHGLWNKFVFYEPSVGVPLIVKAPGLTQPGSVCQTPVSQTSLLATLLELCGISAPSGVDGGSLVPFLREPQRPSDAPVFAQFALRTKNAKYMIRHGDWKYCHYVSDTPELYNLRQDRLEMNNLAGVAQYREKEAELKQRLFAWNRPPESGG
ncbi:MAG: sulfatase-like hydrolase/transferase [Acidobacteria bacterium]|nr:sulfatase-like hydrolase/transferase [Acidobacteriota bacterium]